MTAILCVTPNVALDRALMLPGFSAGGVWRAEEVAITAGGKGLNVARALGRLGQPAHVAGLLGGRTGDRVAAQAEEAGVSARWTRISGSLPPGAPPAAIRCLIEATPAVPVWVDSSGDALADAIAAQVYGIKVNATEAGAVVGSVVSSAADALSAAEILRRKGVRRVAITLGAVGAVLLDDTGAWQAAAPSVKIRNAVGGGDCFLADILVDEI